MKKWISKLLFKIYGWKLIGSVPSDVKKFVLIAAPHSTNFDFFLAMPTMWSLGVPGKFLIKKEHIETFYGFLIKWMGGIAVDRQNQNKDFTEQLKKTISESDEMALLFTPEGTRSKVKKWKSGFYRVAVACNLPILMSYPLHTKKEVHLGELYYPTGDFVTDFTYFEDYYRKSITEENAKFNPVFFDRTKPGA